MARRRSIRSRLRRFVEIGWRRRALLAEAAVLLLLARVALRLCRSSAWRDGSAVSSCLPIRACGRRRHKVPPLMSPSPGEIGWAVTRASRHVPFRAVCLPQAIAARMMLARRGIASVLHFGAAKGCDKPIDAHAWLDAAGVEVTGFPVGAEFAEIACFI